MTRSFFRDDLGKSFGEATPEEKHVGEPSRPRLRRIQDRSPGMTAVPVPTNGTKAKLAAGKLCVGTMLVEIRQPGIMTMLANAGFDFVLVDNEHGPFSIETIAELCRAARERRRDAHRADPGAHLRPRRAVAGWRRAGDHAAAGHRARAGRGMRALHEVCAGRDGGVRCWRRGHTAFKAGPLVETLAAMNRETMLVVQIETPGSGRAAG